jgi:hypothetical protein
MRKSKLLVMLALAGFCGTTQTQARSNKSEIKHLEKQRAHLQDTYLESKERLRELELQNGWEQKTDSTHGNWASVEKQIQSLNWDVTDSELHREREKHEAKMREAAREMARLDKAIRKKAREFRT